ncbi:magnesium transporter NIPA-domain-containing protein [Boletus edulis]|nr:magnesium transporter NIPA-domain-containing protein [Boletus edulis]
MSWPDGPGIALPHLTPQSVIGISVAVTGNVLISLALNLQKLAHLRLDHERQKDLLDVERQSRPPGCDTSARAPRPDTVACFGAAQHAMEENDLFETQPLLPHRSSSQPPPRSYEHFPVNGDDTRSRKSSNAVRSRRHQRKQPFVSRYLPLRLVLGDTSLNSSSTRVNSPAIPVEDVFPQRNMRTNHQSNGNGTSQHVDEIAKESDYLRSKLWWSGFVLMNIGETGNFISYAFAPASVVAPLGTFALVANCFFAPLLLNERFRPRDIFGILLAVIGATTVVLSSPSSDGPPPVLTPDALVEAVTQRPFVIFSIVYLVAAAILGCLSQGSLGRRVVVVDVGLCALFGKCGFTVLATKAISTLLTKEWVNIVAEWITYPVLAVLVITGVLQVRYLNRALKRFDSKIVIPTQFVFFTLSAVVGSAVLYGDFRRASFHEMLTFLYGCAATFAGVFVIASGPNGNTSESVHDEERRSMGLDRFVAPNQAAQTPPRVGARDIPVLRHKQSAMSLVGYTPVQSILLVDTPPRERVGALG